MRNQSVWHNGLWNLGNIQTDCLCGFPYHIQNQDIYNAIEAQCPMFGDFNGIRVVFSTFYNICNIFLWMLNITRALNQWLKVILHPIALPLLFFAHCFVLIHKYWIFSSPWPVFREPFWQCVQLQRRFQCFIKVGTHFYVCDIYIKLYFMAFFMTALHLNFTRIWPLWPLAKYIFLKMKYIYSDNFNR